MNLLRDIKWQKSWGLQSCFLGIKVPLKKKSCFLGRNAYFTEYFQCPPTFVVHMHPRMPSFNTFVSAFLVMF